jgi:hypothetical protein
MGRRARRRGAGEQIQAPGVSYESGEHGTLELRSAMSAATRMAYADVLDPTKARAAAGTEDIWARAVEFLFERLAVSWTVQGVRWDDQKQLLARFRVASTDERSWIRSVLRTHVADNFPELKAP